MTPPRSAHELEYSPSSCIDSIDAELDRYAEASRCAALADHRRLRTGPQPGEGAIVFEQAPGSPLHVFVHGGYWQALSAADSLAPAPELAAAGWSYAAIDYTLAPTATIGEQIEQCARAVHHLVDTLHPSSLVLSGSSAGAHLAAHVAHLAATGQLGVTVDRLVLLSGVYQLHPLLTTYVNDALGLDERAAAAWSVPLEPRPAPQVLVLHGEHETSAFKAQSARVAAAWGVPVVEVVGRNHFDLVHELASIDLRLGVPGRVGVDGRLDLADLAAPAAGVAAERPGAPRRLALDVLHRSPRSEPVRAVPTPVDGSLRPAAAT